MTQPQEKIADSPPNPQWQALHAASPGHSHLVRGIPCQDASSAHRYPLPHAIVCDGRGSSPDSQLGSQLAVATLPRIVYEFEWGILDALDQNNQTLADAAWRNWADAVCRRLFMDNAQHALACGLKPEKLDYTLAIVVVGKNYLGWIRVGDAVVVAEKSVGSEPPIRWVLSSEPKDAGGFVNQTKFLRQSQEGVTNYEAGVYPLDRVQGLACFSDGASTLFMDQLKNLPAEALSVIWKQMRDQSMSGETLHEFFQKDIWKSHTGDDRSMAVLARNLSGEGAEEEAVPNDPNDMIYDRLASQQKVKQVAAGAIPSGKTPASNQSEPPCSQGKQLPNKESEPRNKRVTGMERLIERFRTSKRPHAGAVGTFALWGAITLLLLNTVLLALLLQLYFFREPQLPEDGSPEAISKPTETSLDPETAPNTHPFDQPYEPIFPNSDSETLFSPIKEKDFLHPEAPQRFEDTKDD